MISQRWCRAGLVCAKGTRVYVPGPTAGKCANTELFALQSRAVCRRELLSYGILQGSSAVTHPLHKAGLVILGCSLPCLHFRLTASGSASRQPALKEWGSEAACNSEGNRPGGSTAFLSQQTTQPSPSFSPPWHSRGEYTVGTGHPRGSGERWNGTDRGGRTKVNRYHHGVCIAEIRHVGMSQLESNYRGHVSIAKTCQQLLVISLRDNL